MKELNVQQTIDGVRYQLPGRSFRKGLGGIPLILFGSFFAGIPITMVVVSISQLFRPDDGMPWWGVLMMTLIYGAVFLTMEKRNGVPARKYPSSSGIMKERPCSFLSTML